MLVCRCAIMKKFDATHANVRLDSLGKMVDINKHILFAVFPGDAVPYSRGFCSTILLELKNIVYSAF